MLAPCSSRLYTVNTVVLDYHGGGVYNSYMQKLTNKQRLFIENYINNGMNASQAALSAGYSKKTAAAIGFENLKKPRIQKAIQGRIKELLNDTELLTMQWLTQVKSIAMFDLRKAAEWHGRDVRLIPSDEIDDLTAAAIQEVSTTETENGGSVKIKAESKIKALELIGKYLAILNENPPDYENGIPNAQQLDAEKRRERIAELTRKLNHEHNGEGDSEGKS